MNEYRLCVKRKFFLFLVLLLTLWKRAGDPEFSGELQELFRPGIELGSPE
jgi:hypothetical protein